MESPTASPNYGSWRCPDGRFTKNVLEPGSGVIKPKEGARCIICVEPLADPTRCVEPLADPTRCVEPLADPTRCVEPLADPTRCVEPLSDPTRCVEPLADPTRCVEPLADPTRCVEPLADPTRSAGYPTGIWVQIELGEGDAGLDRLVDQCLETMLPGEVCRVDGLLGVQFVLKLASFEDGKEAWELDVNGKMERAARDREMGGKAFRDGNLEGAEQRYARALRLLVCTPGEAEEERIALLSNLAACDLKKGRLREAEVRCTRVLDKEPKHLKALYRRGMARAGMSDWTGARADLENLLKLDPGNKEARREILKVREKQKNEQAQISRALGKMFL